MNATLFDRAALTALLESRGLPFEAHEHPAVYTAAEANGATAHLRGAPTKNLFLRDDKGTRHFLAAVGHSTHVDLKTLAEALGVKKLSFASADRLKRFLGVEPGSVTLFGLINDRERAVECVIDRTLWDAAEFQCHPLTNTATFVVPKASLEQFFVLTGHSPKIIDIPDKKDLP